MKKVLSLLLSVVFLTCAAVLPAAADEALPADPGVTESAEAAENLDPVENDLSQWGLPNADNYLVIWLNDRFQPIPLLPEFVGQRLSITLPDGGSNVVEFTEHGFVMAEADCDDQLCVTQGEVTPENREERILDGFIVCLPHYLQLELMSRAELYELIEGSVVTE